MSVHFRLLFNQLTLHLVFFFIRSCLPSLIANLFYVWILFVFHKVNYFIILYSLVPNKTSDQNKIKQSACTCFDSFNWCLFLVNFFYLLRVDKPNNDRRHLSYQATNVIKFANLLNRIHFIEFFLYIIGFYIEIH